MPEIIGEQVVLQQGSFKRVRRWYRGKYPEIGVLQPPWSGLSGDWETITEEGVISPLVMMRVDS